MNRHLDMPCCMCSKQVREVEHIAVDEYDDVIVMCPACYNKARKFFNGGEKDGKSR